MDFFQNLLFVVLTAAVPILTTYLCKFLYEKWNIAKQQISNKKIQDVLNQVFDMVFNCVQTVNQTFTDELKKKGEFTEEAAKEAFTKCKTMVLQMLSDDAKQIINQIYGDIDIYLNTLIEATVKQAKQ